MKKMVTVILLLGALALVYQFFVSFVISRHDASYSVKTSDNSYMVKENYRKEKNFNMYSLLIEDKDKNTFAAIYNVDLNRSSRIIKDVKEYSDGNLVCIAPILKDKKIENLSCRLDNNQVSISYLHQIGNTSINKFIDSLKQDGYTFNNEIDSNNNISSTSSNISTFDNLEDNLYVTMWGYKGVYVLNQNQIEYKDYLNKDSYFNTYSILCDKYYVSLDTDDNEIKAFYVANIKDGGKAHIDFDFSLSKNSYINGIYKGKIYITDMDRRVEYAINPASEKIEEVGSGNKAKYFDGESLQEVDISELINEKKYFIDDKVDEKISSKYSGLNLIYSHDSYYYKDINNNVYQVLKDFPDYKILLFRFDDFKEMKVKNNNIFGIVGDTVYMYNNNIGLRKVAQNRELTYNYQNIYDIYYK